MHITLFVALFQTHLVQFYGHYSHKRFSLLKKRVPLHLSHEVRFLQSKQFSKQASHWEFSFIKRPSSQERQI